MTPSERSGCGGASPRVAGRTARALLRQPDMRRPVLVYLLAPLLCGVAACTRHVRPDEMSAAEHRRQAELELAAATATTKKIERTESAPASGPTRGGPDVSGGDFSNYDPTTYYVIQAERHRGHAIEHEHAAAELVAFEDAECKALSPQVRASCPFMGPVRKVEQIDRGVRLYLAQGAPIAAVTAHMRCHQAFARTRGYAVSECPLMLRGASIGLSPDGNAIDFVSDDRKVTSALRKRAEALLTAK